MTRQGQLLRSICTLLTSEMLGCAISGFAPSMYIMSNRKVLWELRHVLVRVTVLFKGRLGELLGSLKNRIRDPFVHPLGELAHPGELKFEHLVLHLVVHLVDNLGGLLDQLLTSHVGHLDLLQLGLGGRLGLASSTAPVAVASARGFNAVELSSCLLGPAAKHCCCSKRSDG